MSTGSCLASVLANYMPPEFEIAGDLTKIESCDKILWPVYVDDIIVWV